MGLSKYDTVHKRDPDAGIALSRIHRHESPALAGYDVVSFDMCAAFRKSVSPVASITPREATRIFLSTYRWVIAGASVVIIVFDRPSQITEMRHQHYLRNSAAHDPKHAGKPGWVLSDVDGLAYKAEEAPPEDSVADLITPDHLPTSYLRLYNNSKCKAALWDVLIEVLREEVNPRGAQWVIVGQDAAVTTLPYAPELVFNPTTYGEGDISSVLIADELRAVHGLSTVLVVTNDIDIRMISTFRSPSTDVAFGKVSTSRLFPLVQPYHPAVVESVKTKGVKKWGADNTVPAFEIASTPRWLDGLGLVALMNKTLMIVAAGKFDYCAGLAPCGWCHNKVFEFTTTSKGVWSAPITMELVGGKRVVVFDPLVFHSLVNELTYYTNDVGIRKSRRAVRKNIHTDSFDIFGRVVHDMLWMIRYWAGIDSSRDRAGPVPPDYDELIFPEFDTISEFIDCTPRQYEWRLHRLEETHP